jgi:hypothetical protein
MTSVRRETTLTGGSHLSAGERERERGEPVRDQSARPRAESGVGPEFVPGPFSLFLLFLYFYFLFFSFSFITFQYSSK